MMHCDKHNLTTTGINCPYCENPICKYCGLKITVQGAYCSKNTRVYCQPLDENHYAESDRLREEIRKKGYEVIDTPEGQKVKKRIIKDWADSQACSDLKDK